MKNFSHNKNIFGTLFLALSAIIWGSTFFLQKEAVGSLAPFTLNAYRGLIGALVLGIGLLITKQNPFSKFKKGLATGALYCAALALQTIGLVYTSAFNSGFITGLFVLFVPVFSCLIFHTRISRTTIVTVLLGLIGLWFATGGIHKLNYGDILNFIGAICWAFYVLAADRALKSGITPYVLNFQQLFLTGTLSLIGVIFIHASAIIPNLHTLYLVLYLAIVANVIAYCLQFIAQQHIAPVNVAMILLLEPLFSGVFAWTLGGEDFSISKCFGGMLIILAIVLTNWRSNKVYIDDAII